MKKVDTAEMLDLLLNCCSSGQEERDFMEEVFDWVDEKSCHADDLRDEIEELTKRAEKAESEVEDLRAEVENLNDKLAKGVG